MFTIYNSWLIAFELQQMRDYLDTISIMFQDYEEKLEKKYMLEELTDMDEEDEDRYEQYLQNFASVKGDFPRRFYSSFIVSWFSLIEDGLINLCKSLDLSLKITIDELDKFGKGVNRAKNFLEKTANYKIDQNHWNELTHVIKIRNYIVHTGGRFAYSENKPEDTNKVIPVAVNGDTYYVYCDKNLFEYMKKYEIIDFYTTFFINPSFDYGIHLVEFGDEFFGKILHDFELL